MSDFSVYKTLLEEQLIKITAELKVIAIHNTVTDDWEAIPETEGQSLSADENTEADVVEGWNERRAVLSALEQEYRDIRRALKKVSSGTYGVCEVGNEPIEEERLMMRPEARTCTKHMEEEDLLSW
jgi:DnaK suppressor protein